MNREMESEMAFCATGGLSASAMRKDAQNAEVVIDERAKWIEDEVEELERWDGME
jgi:hypothetical protein